MAVASAFAHRVVYKSLRFVEGWPVGKHLRPVAVNISLARNACNVNLFDVALRQLTDCITSIPKNDTIRSHRGGHRGSPASMARRLCGTAEPLQPLMRPPFMAILCF